MTASFVFRPMRLADTPQVHALEHAIFPSPWALKSFRFEVQNNGTSQPWVAALPQDDGRQQIVAYIVVWRLVDELHVANLAVAPDYRRLGLARRLLSDALQRAAGDGFARACLEVRAGNRAAQALYKDFGFEPVGLRQRYYQDNREDALLMCLEDLAERRPLKVAGL